MINKHTAGKWELEAGTRLNVTAGKSGFVIANITKDGISHMIGNEAEALANAKLIAAAPELLQMVYDLKECVKRLSQDNLSQYDRDTEAQWEGEAHALLVHINPNYYRNANEKQ